MPKIILSEEDRKELVKLYETAETTPVIWMPTETNQNPKSWADKAWDDVRDKMLELGKKYGFDPRKMTGINKKTGEVTL